MATLYITHPACHLHDMGPWHPECPGRLQAIDKHLVRSGLANVVHTVQASEASDADMLRIHTAGHLNYLKQLNPQSGIADIDGDTAMCPHTLQAIRVAAGAGIQAVDALMEGRHKTAFCAVRPPGHHATPDRAMGFCFINNIAVAAAYALDVHGLERVAIIDFDVHHGNGTEDALAGDPRVLMCGFYQHPFYPGTRHTPPASNMINIPVSAGTDGAELRRIASDDWMPALRQFAPQMVFISAGFDAHQEDDIGQLGMSEDDFAWITEQLVDLANHYAEGRVVSMLEGGYNLSALGRSAVAHIKALSKVE